MRFKPGQKVRVVKPYSGSDFNDGEIVKIVCILHKKDGHDVYGAVSCEVDEDDTWYLYEDEVAPFNNGDKIRAMNNKELANYLYHAGFFDFNCRAPLCKVCPHDCFSCYKIPDACVDGIESFLNDDYYKED